jgi:ferrous iron transport protein B
MGIRPDNWPATVGLLTGVLAKEVVVGTLNTLYAHVGVYGSMIDKFDGQIGAFAYLLFVLLYFPCVSTLGAMLRELPRGWALFSACWTTGVAYSVAVMFYQGATWMRHPAASMTWLFSLSALLISVVVLMRWYARQDLSVKPLKTAPAGDMA